MRGWPVAAAIALLAGLALAPIAAAGTVQEDYAGFGAVATEACDGVDYPWAICVEASDDAAAAAATIDDLGDRPVAGWLAYEDAEGNVLYSEFFCGSILRGVSTGTAYVHVVVQGPALTAYECDDPASATTGTVEVTVG